MIDPDLKFLWSPENLTSGATITEFVNLKDSNTNLSLLNVSVNNSFSTAKINTASLFSEDLDYIDGGAGNDLLYGGNSSDIILGGLGNDLIDGGSGTDTVRVDGLFGSGVNTNYSISKFNDGSWNISFIGPTIAIYPPPATNGTDKLINVERLRFTDKSFALDLDGNAGTTAKILGAVFGKESLNNKNYVGIGLSYLDGGWTYEKLAALALDAAGAKTNDQIVSLLWTNVVGAKPTAEDKQPFIALLENGMTAGSLAQYAADTSFNITNINLVGLAQTGIEYIP